MSNPKESFKSEPWWVPNEPSATDPEAAEIAEVAEVAEVEEAEEDDVEVEDEYCGVDCGYKVEESGVSPEDSFFVCPWSCNWIELELYGLIDEDVKFGICAGLCPEVVVERAVVVDMDCCEKFGKLRISLDAEPVGDMEDVEVIGRLDIVEWDADVKVDADADAKGRSCDVGWGCIEKGFGALVEIDVEGGWEDRKDDEGREERGRNPDVVVEGLLLKLVPRPLMAFKLDALSDKGVKGVKLGFVRLEWTGVEADL